MPHSVLDCTLMGKMYIHVLSSAISTHSVTYSVEIKRISRAMKGISPAPSLARFPLLPPPVAVFGLIPEGQGGRMHHGGSVSFQKEEICSSCLGEVGFLCRRADSMVLQRMLLLIQCRSTFNKTPTFSGWSEVFAEVKESSDKSILELKRSVEITMRLRFVFSRDGGGTRDVLRSGNALLHSLKLY